MAEADKSRGVAGIELGSYSEQATGFEIIGPRDASEPFTAAQDIVVRLHAAGPFRGGARLFDAADAYGEPADDTAREAILNSENIFELLIVAFRPKQHVVRCVRQPGADAQPVARPAHAAVNDVTHVEVASQLLRLPRRAFVPVQRRARENAQAAKPAEGCDHIVLKTVAEIIVAPFTAGLVGSEEQNCDGRRTGDRRLSLSKHVENPPSNDGHDNAEEQETSGNQLP